MWPSIPSGNIASDNVLSSADCFVLHFVIKTEILQAYNHAFFFYSKRGSGTTFPPDLQWCSGWNEKQQLHTYIANEEEAFLSTKAKHESKVHDKRVEINCRTAEFLNPLTPNIKEQILLSCRHTFLIKVLGRSYQNIKNIYLG